MAQVIIAGRPNVGKSAIFNRLARRRAAIVHQSEGVTRDRIEQQVQYAGKTFTLVDTGGLGAPPTIDRMASESARRTITASIRQQVEAALADADAVIMVTDLRAGAMPLDLETADLLRRTGRPVYLAANKADNPAHDTAAADFQDMGFPVFPVSALQNRGFEELMRAVTANLPEDRPADPADDPELRITVLGRPNVGKSSFINALLRDERLIVSDLPGTTRDCVDVTVRMSRAGRTTQCILTDTAGIRRVSRLREAVDHIGLHYVEKRLRRADVAILLMDAASGPTAQDKKIANMIVNHHKGIVLALNKWDLTRAYATPRQGVTAVREAWPFLTHAPVTCCSAQTGFNIRHTLLTALHVAENTARQLPTGPLNRTLTRATTRVQPPMVKGRRLKLFYATQTGTRPVQITLFVNQPNLLTTAYATWLEKCLRRDFRLTGASVILRQRVRPKN